MPDNKDKKTNGRNIDNIIDDINLDDLRKKYKVADSEEHVSEQLQSKTAEPGSIIETPAAAVPNGSDENSINASTVPDRSDIKLPDIQPDGHIGIDSFKTVFEELWDHGPGVSTNQTDMQKSISRPVPVSANESATPQDEHTDALNPSLRIVYEVHDNRPTGFSGRQTVSEQQVSTTDSPKEDKEKIIKERDKKILINDSLSSMRIIYEAADTGGAVQPHPDDTIIASDKSLSYAEPQPACVNETADSHDDINAVPSLKNRFINGLLDFSGLLLLVFSLIIFGFPIIYGKSKEKFSAVACILLTAVIVICSGFTANRYFSAGTSPESEQTMPPETSDVQTASSSNLPDAFALLKPTTDGVSYPQGILEKYKSVYAANSDTTGWLKIPNTSIDTAVTKCPVGDRNMYYLENDFYGRNSKYGTAFLDFQNGTQELSQNSIIYGHRYRDSLGVFNDLYKYMDYNFYINNPIIEYGTLFADYKWKIFAVFLSSTNKTDDNGYFFCYIYPEINASKFTGYLNQIIQRSRYFTDIDVNDSDKILTLSTCVYDNDFSGRKVDTRLVVVARLLREGESNEIDISKVVDNPNFRRPQVWYDHSGKSNPYSKSEKWAQ